MLKPDFFYNWLPVGQNRFTGYRKVSSSDDTVGVGAPATWPRQPPSPGIWTPHRPHRPNRPTVRSFIHDHKFFRADFGTQPRSIHVKNQNRTVMLPRSEANGSPLAAMGTTHCRSSQSDWIRPALSFKLKTTQLCLVTVTFRPTTSFSSISESPKLWRLNF